MDKDTALEEGNARLADECTHHWIIDSPHGPTSWGICKICSTKREFPNSAPDYLHEGGPGPGGLGWSGLDRGMGGISDTYSTWIDRSSPGDDF